MARLTPIEQIATQLGSSAAFGTSANTANTLVRRDGAGNFSAGTITAALTGVASQATKLATARNINGVAFDGTANITVTAAAGTLTGTALPAAVVTSSLTDVATLRTQNPGGGQGVWKVGKVTAAVVALDVANYVEVMIDGVVVKLGIVL